MQGLVIKNTGSWYTVLTDDGQLLQCKVKGNFRLKGIRSTNPVAVGDRVVLSAPQGNLSSQGNSLPQSNLSPHGNPLPQSNLSPLTSHLSPLYITALEDRRNYIIRKSQNLSKQSHIIAANVDQAFLIVTVDQDRKSVV